jgi:hypothetical protein
MTTAARFNGGLVTDEEIKAYIEGLSTEQDDTFRVEGEGAPPGSAPSP